MKPVRIAIVGAGVAGLATALYGHRLGHDVTVLERFAAAKPVGSGLMLQPTGLTVLNDLGLAPAILARGQRIDRLRGADARSGRVVLDVAYRGGRFGLAVQRAALFGVLYNAVRAAGIRIVTSTEIAGVVRTTGGVELLGQESRGAGNSFDLVIDAAGPQSPLRDPAGPGARSKPLSYGAFWATLDWPASGFDPHALEQRYRAARIMVGVLPTGRREPGAPPQCAFFWSLKPADAEGVRARGIEAWKTDVLTHWPATAPLLDQIAGFDDLTLARYGHHTMRQPYRDGVVHIGDSAHATSPQLGQGANMALLDAAAISHAMQSATRLDEVGPAYAKARRLHVNVFQIMSRVLTPFYQSDGYLIPLARDTLVSTLARVPPMPSILAALVSGTVVDPFRSIGLTEWWPDRQRADR